MKNSPTSNGTSIRIVNNRGLTTKRSGAIGIVYATRGNRGGRCAIVIGETTTRSNDISRGPARPISARPASASVSARGAGDGNVT